MAEAETTPNEQANSLDAQRDSILKQLQDEESGVASVPPEAGDHAPATDDKPANGGEQEPKPDAETEKKSREEKEESRKDKTWQQLNAEKEDVRRMKAEAERLRAEAEQLRAEAAERAKTAGQYTAEDFETAAQRFEAEGDAESAALAKERARQIRADVEAAKAKNQRQQYEADLKAVVAQARADHPELDDPENPLTKTVKEVMENRPVFKTYANGLIDAVRVAQLKLKADGVESLQKELDEVKSKLADAEKRLQPGGATPSAPERSSKGFDQLSSKEQRAILMSVAMAADSDGVGIDALSFRNK